jgi:hypothetical protein
MNDDASFKKRMRLDALSCVRLAPIATHEPVGAVADCDEGKASTDKWARHTSRFVTTTAAIALTKSVSIPGSASAGIERAAGTAESVFSVVAPSGSIPDPEQVEQPARACLILRPFQQLRSFAMLAAIGRHTCTEVQVPASYWTMECDGAPVLGLGR